MADGAVVKDIYGVGCCLESLTRVPFNCAAAQLERGIENGGSGGSQDSVSGWATVGRVLNCATCGVK